MSVFRRLYRKLLDHELGVLGEQLEKLEDRHQDLGTQLEAFGVRFERQRSKLGMRALRQERGDMLPAQQEFLDLVNREQRGDMRGQARDDDDWYQFPGGKGH